MADESDFIEFVAACGHKTTAKKLGQICPECFINTHQELAALRAELEQAKGTIALQRAWIEKAGHRPECPARGCAVCGYTQGPHEWGVIRMGHAFQPGPCDCGYAELVGG